MPAPTRGTRSLEDLALELEQLAYKVATAARRRPATDLAIRAIASAADVLGEATTGIRPLRPFRTE